MKWGYRKSAAASGFGEFHFSDNAVFRPLRVLLGLIIGFVAQHRTSVEVAAIIQRFLHGTGASWEWDDFISIPLSDPTLEEVRRRCGELPAVHPPHLKGWYCNEEGLKALRDLVRQLSA